MRWSRLQAIVTGLLVLLCLALSAQAQRNLVVGASSSAGDKRVALVIGNSAYAQGPLRNPVNDARAMAARLRSLGFDVILRENLKTREISAVYREFRSRIAPGGVALVFYAGHGVQFKGQNYFPAVDSDINSEEDVPLQSLNLGTLLDNMEEAKAAVNMVFLDACRDNPFARRFRSGARGLAKVESASGTLIHYATKPGSVAADGNGANGTYTEALLAQIGEGNVPVEIMLKRVTNRVVSLTGGKQEPWIEGSLRGEFYFASTGAAPVVAPSAPPVQVAMGNSATTTRPAPAPVAASAEDAMWNEVKASASKEYYDAYLQQYPQGKYIALARIEVKKISDQEAAQREAEAREASRLGKVFKDCSDCPEMVVIPAGSFQMGGDRDNDEKPVHTVNIAKPFALGKTEVTQGQWQAIMGSNPSNFKACGADCPVESVSWNDAQEFVRRLNVKTGKQYRLPSEAEWEYACRAGGRDEYCGGSNVDAVGWYGAYAYSTRKGNSEKTTNLVGRKQANAFGLYDMSGNVWEWVQDWYHDSYNGASSDGNAWETGGDQKARVLRGGSWDGSPVSLRAAVRSGLSPEVRYFISGFRLARMLP